MVQNTDKSNTTRTGIGRKITPQQKIRKEDGQKSSFRCITLTRKLKGHYKDCWEELESTARLLWCIRKNLPSKSRTKRCILPHNLVPLEGHRLQLLQPRISIMHLDFAKLPFGRMRLHAFCEASASPKCFTRWVGMLSHAGELKKKTDTTRMKRATISDLVAE